MRFWLTVGVVSLLAIASSVYFVSSLERGTPISASTAAAFARWRLQYKTLMATPAETQFRARVFESKLKMVEQANVEYEAFVKQKGLPPLTGPMFSLKEYSHLTDEEFKATRGGIDISRFGPSEEVTLDAPSIAPKMLRQDSIVIPVRDQGACGASWAISAAGTIEKHYWDIRLTQVEVSVQELIDCSHENSGCGGGNPLDAYTYVSRNGIGLASSYPYTQVKGPCLASPVKRIFLGSSFGRKQVDFSFSNARLLQAKGYFAGIYVYGTGKFSHISSTDDIYDASASGECDYTVDVAMNLSGGSTNHLVVMAPWGTSWGVTGRKRVKPCNNDNNLLGTPSYLTHTYA